MHTTVPNATPAIPVLSGTTGDNAAVRSEAEQVLLLTGRLCELSKYLAELESSSADHSSPSFVTRVNCFLAGIAIVKQMLEAIQKKL
jgi:hypothetical protein